MAMTLTAAVEVLLGLLFFMWWLRRRSRQGCTD
jgi:hypothetical protein